MLDNGVPDLCTRLLRLCAELRTIGSPIRRIGTSVGDGSGSIAERRDVHQRGDAHEHVIQMQPGPVQADRASHCYFVALVSITRPVGIWPSLGCTVTGTTVASR